MSAMKSRLVPEKIRHPPKVINTAILTMLESVCHNENAFLLWMFVLGQRLECMYAVVQMVDALQKSKLE